MAGRDHELPGRLAARRPAEGMMIILDVVLMALISAAIVGLLAWSICTQYRDPGCARLRIRRRLQLNVRLVALDEPELARQSI